MAKVSNYIQQYIDQSKEISDETQWPQYIRNFFDVFQSSLQTNCTKAKTGNRTFVAASFSEAFRTLFPLLEEVKSKDKPSLIVEDNLADYMDCNFPLSRKFMDFVVVSKKRRVFIEYKSNFQFVDLATAMVEMMLLKKYIKKGIKYKTASIHLFPYVADISALKNMNKALGRPIDHIWILCNSGKRVVINPKMVREIRNTINNFLIRSP